MLTFTITWHDTKVAIVKTICKKQSTKYDKMAIIKYGIIFISSWLREQQQYKKILRLIWF